MSAFVAFSARAEKQIENIALDLADHSSKLAREFVNAVDAKIEQLAQFPESGAVYEDEVRRLLLLRSPFSLFTIFDALQNAVTIIGCFHDRSDPQSWHP